MNELVTGGMALGMFAAATLLWRRAQNWGQFLHNIVPAITVFGVAGFLAGWLIGSIFGAK